MKKAEVLIIGGGIVGLSIARNFINAGYGNVAVIEKESEVAVHASGRNSGVLHAGIYYHSESLKARFCLDGNRLLKSFCKEKDLFLKESGKVIVAKNSEELPTLYHLEKQAKANGANVELVTEEKLIEIEPAAKTNLVALYSKDTAIINPKQVMQALISELTQKKGFRIYYNTTFLNPGTNNSIYTSDGRFEFDLLINAAGSFADKIAHQYGVGKNLTLIPFKGIYQKLKPQFSGYVNGNIYPVPDIKNPFLGVHFTKNFLGDVYVGPTAIPAFGRENYGFFQGMDRDFLKILGLDFSLFFHNKNFRRVSLREPFKYFKKFFFRDATRLVKNLEYNWLISTQKVGIRPQLVNIENKELIMDFVVEKKHNTVHVLNAISPAFTSAFSFSHYIVHEICL